MAIQEVITLSLLGGIAAIQFGLYKNSVTAGIWFAGTSLFIVAILATILDRL